MHYQGCPRRNGHCLNVRRGLVKCRRRALNSFPANIKQSLAFSNEVWVDHGEDMEVRFNAWLAKGT